MYNKKICYVLYVIGFAGVVSSLVIKYLLSINIGEAMNICILGIGCIFLGIGKLMMMQIKKQEGDRYTNDLIVSLAFFALAGYAAFTLFQTGF